MNLKPQDILVLLKLVAAGVKPWSFNKLAYELGMSPSEVHAATNRALMAGLAIRHEEQIQPHIRNLEEFLVHGIRFVFVPERGGISRGMPTSYAAEPLASKFMSVEEDLPAVWPSPEGQVRGETISPLYKSAPSAAEKDPELYTLLALVDAIRCGRARERDLAIKELKKSLAAYG